jgi:hypothetical protein
MAQCLETERKQSVENTRLKRRAKYFRGARGNRPRREAAANRSLYRFISINWVETLAKFWRIRSAPRFADVETVAGVARHRDKSSGGAIPQPKSSGGAIPQPM